MLQQHTRNYTSRRFEAIQRCVLAAAAMAMLLVYPQPGHSTNPSVETILSEVQRAEAARESVTAGIGRILANASRY